MWCDRVFTINRVVRDAVGSKNLFDRSFSTGCVDRMLDRKRWDSKTPLFNSLRKSDFVGDQKRAFSIHVLVCDCVRIDPKQQVSTKQERTNAKKTIGSGGYSTA